jgi:hypothetical protein
MIFCHCLIKKIKNYPTHRHPQGCNTEDYNHELVKIIVVALVQFPLLEAINLKLKLNIFANY